MSIILAMVGAISIMLPPEKRLPASNCFPSCVIGEPDAQMSSIGQNLPCCVFVGDKGIDHFCSQRTGDSFRLFFSAGNGHGFFGVFDVLHGGA